MPRRNTILFLLTALVLPACSSSKSEDREVESALQLAESAREDFIAPSLEMLLAFADRIAPLCQARSEGELLEIVARLGCSLSDDEDGAYAVLFRDVEAGAQGFSMRARLEFLGERDVVGSPEAARSMRARIEAAGDFSLVEGELECIDDPSRGIVIEGAFATDFLGVCAVWTYVEHVTARPVADAAGGVMILFTSGSAELDVSLDEGPGARASVALVGRRALVIVEVEGQQTVTELELG